MVCLAPLETRIMRARVADVVVALELRDDGDRPELDDAIDAGIAREAAANRACTPASAICMGVSKSGSPTPQKLMTSLPSAFRRAVSAVTASVGEA